MFRLHGITPKSLLGAIPLRSFLILMTLMRRPVSIKRYNIVLIVYISDEPLLWTLGERLIVRISSKFYFKKPLNSNFQHFKYAHKL